MKLIARKIKKKRAIVRARPARRRHGALTFSAARWLPVRRAIDELRRGEPVLLFPTKGPASLVASTENCTSDLIDSIRRVGKGTCHLLLTAQRATTLRIRLYTDDVVAVEIPKDDAVRAVLTMSDPTQDLHNPLMGPWFAKRSPLSAGAVAAIKLAKEARLLPAVIEAVVPRARALEFADQNLILKVPVSEIDSFEPDRDMRAVPVAHARLPLENAEATLVMAFRGVSGAREHLALIIGSPEPPGPILVRLHSECLTGDLLGSLKCDCGDQLRGAIGSIGREGSGVLLYLAQEGRGIGLINKLKAYELQDQGFDTVEANQRLGFQLDERDFVIAAEILKRLGYSSVRLMTNNPFKVRALSKHGIEVVERVPHHFTPNPHNVRYLATKAAKAGHLT